MLKKFKDFDVKEYKERKLLEKLESENHVESDPDFDTTLIKDDKFLLKISRVVYNAFVKNGLEDYKPSSLAVSINGSAGVLFRNCKDIKKCIVACKNQYDTFIAVFDDFEVDQKNKAIATYSSSEMGLSAIIKYAIEDLKGVESLDEALEIDKSFRAAAGYKAKNIKDFANLPDELKDFLVKLVNENGGPSAARVISACVNMITKGFHTDDAICLDLIAHINPRRPDTLPSASLIRYFVAICVDAMNKTYPELEGLLSGEVEVIKSGVEKSVGELYDVEEYDKKKAERAKKKLERETRDFQQGMEVIRRQCEAYCKYVKGNNLITSDIQGYMKKPGMYISGKAGIGKSYTVNQVLKKNHMVEGKDYVKLGSVPTDSANLYRYLYRYNGKLIIFDDSANMLDGSLRVGFWKQALQTRKGTSGGILDYSRSTKEDGEEFYDIIQSKKTRQQRYFEEIGAQSRDAKADFIARFTKKEVAKLPRGERPDMDLISTQAEEKWRDKESKIKPRIPNRFEYVGCVIIIGNTSFDALLASVIRNGMSEDDFNAVADRMATVDVTPPGESLWINIQETLREQQRLTEEELSSDECLIPRKCIDRFIEEVDMLLGGEEDDENYEYKRLSWRTVDTIGGILKGNDNLEDFFWQKSLRDSMRQRIKK